MRDNILLLPSIIGSIKVDKDLENLYNGIEFINLIHQVKNNNLK